MEAWAIVVITISSGLAVFILIFWLKQRKNKRKLIHANDSMQVIVQAQTQQPPQFQQPFPQHQNSNPYQSQPAYNPQQQYPPQYSAPYPPQQQQQTTIGFIPQQQQLPYPPQQQSTIAYIPSTSSQGTINARDPQVYYNPTMSSNITLNSGYTRSHLPVVAISSMPTNAPR